MRQGENQSPDQGQDQAAEWILDQGGSRNGYEQCRTNPSVANDQHL